MQRADVPSALLADVETRLGITWTDPVTDERVRGWIASGTEYVDRIAGERMDYTRDGAARTLMMEYVRYARDEALDVFENNYLSMILELQNDMGVTRYVEEAVSAGSCDLGRVQ